MAIYDKSHLYTFLSRVARLAFMSSYRSIEYVGTQRIPQNAAILYAPNHCNAMMDALSVLYIDNQDKVFVSRADIFRNPHVAALLRKFRMMPIHRVRDGLDEVRRNDATIAEAVAALRHGMPFCIMVEGTHHPERTLLPLKKGVFRIALEAHRVIGEQMPVYIVPVRLEYRDLYHLWDSMRVTIGEPMLVTGENTPVHINEMLRDLTVRMQAQISPTPWAETDNNCREEHVRIGYKLFLALTAPIAAICGLMTLPIWLGEIVIRKTVEDECFHTTLLFVWRIVWLILSLFVLFLPWMFLEEWRYRVRQLRNF